MTVTGLVPMFEVRATKNPCFMLGGLGCGALGVEARLMLAASLQMSSWD